MCRDLAVMLMLEIDAVMDLSRKVYVYEWAME